MKKPKIFQKYFLLASSLIVFFIILGIFFSSFLIRLIDTPGEMAPPVFFAQLIDKIDANDKVKAIKELQKIHTNMPIPKIELIDENGQILFPKQKGPLKNWENLNKPKEDYAFIEIDSKKRRPPPMGPFLFELFRPPKPPKNRHLVKLSGIPTNYVLLSSPDRMGPPGGPPHRRWTPLIGLASLFVSLLFGVGASVALIYARVKKGVQAADDVIWQLQHGNLKARFNIKRKDEFGQAMLRFNTMADEVEKLFLNLQEKDQTRTLLLQELAHDLRTPIASIKTILDTLNTKRKTLDSNIQDELFLLATRETEYFERLVEDLLFLAQIENPNNMKHKENVDLVQILEEVSEDVRIRYQQSGQNIQLTKNIHVATVQIVIEPHLLRRLFRNALDNAFSFAEQNVKISLTPSEEGVLLTIEDDGPGFSEEALKEFGKRRVSRKISTDQSTRISVGLGSVVMQRICDSMNAQLKVQNKIQQSIISGSSVSIFFPSSLSSHSVTDDGHSAIVLN